MTKIPEEFLNFNQILKKIKEVKSQSTYRELTFLCQEMIDFLNLKQKMVDKKLHIDDERPKFLFQISQKTMRLLTEAMYMKNKENQKLKIIKIYNWYLDKTSRNKDLKKITERTEKEWYQEEEEEPPKEEPVKNEEIKKHRCFIGGYESAAKRLLEYNTKKVNTATKISKITFGDENVNIYGKSVGYDTMTNFKKINDLNLPTYISTSQNSTKYGTFYNKGKAKPEINTGTDWFSKTGLDFKKEDNNINNENQKKEDIKNNDKAENIDNNKNEELNILKNDLINNKEEKNENEIKEEHIEKEEIKEIKQDNNENQKNKVKKNQKKK